MDHVPTFVAMYAGTSENIRRKIILCAYKNNASAFIRGLKEQYPSMKEWMKRAFLIACSIQVPDECKYFLRYASTLLPSESYLADTLIKWPMTR